MASQVSPLLPPSQNDLPDDPTWRFDTAQTRGTQRNSHDLLVPRTSESETRLPSTSVSSTAYEPSNIESDCSKEKSSATPSLPPRTGLAAWSLEIGAIIMSIGSIITIVAVLYRENNKSLDRWPLQVSLNTVISTLGTFARVTLAFALSACVGQQKWSWLHKRSDSLVAFQRFDEAAKGPWGGTRLFIWLKARHWAALGAFVIMGTIAFDPLLQASIAVYGRLDDITPSSNATIAHAGSIDGGTFTFNTNKGSITQNATHKMSSFLEVSSRPDFGIPSSVYSGFRKPSTPSEEKPDFTCTTGNCTWPLFASAAVCSSCIDVSPDLGPSAEYGLYGVSIPWRHGYAATYEGDYTIWGLPTATIRNYNQRYDAGNKSYPQTTLVMNTTLEAVNTIAHKELEAMLLTFTVIRASEEFLNGGKLWNDTRPVATECALYLCTNAYRSVSTNNVLEEHLVGSWSQREPRSFEADYSYYTTPINSSWAEINAATIGSSLYDRNELHTDLQLLIPPGVLNSSDEADRRFNISQTFIFSTIEWLVSFTTLSSKQTSSTEGMDNIGWPATTERGMPLIVDALWNSTNLTTTFDNVARSITNQLRNTSPDQQEGALQTWTIHVKVYWWYLTYPIGMLTMGLLYVVLVIVESTRLRIPVWKESVRPTLLYGFNEETQRLMREEAHDKNSVTTVRYRMDEKEDCLRLMADRKV